MTTSISRRQLLAAGTAFPVLASTGPVEAGEASAFMNAFRTPPATKRPKVRWWLPGAELDDRLLASQLADLVDAGFGAAEIANMSGQGWGTQAWRDHVTYALETADKLDLTLDVTVGPRWPASAAGLDASSPAASQVLLHGEAFVGTETGFSDVLPRPIPKVKHEQAAPPPPGAGDGPPPPGERDPGADLPLTLVAVTASRILSGSGADKPVMLDPLSATDLTDRVRDGRLTWRPEAGRWILIAFWRRGSGKKADGVRPVICHFSKAGTDALLDGWEQDLRDPRFRAALAKAGGDWFEDSVELTQQTQWPAAMLDEITARRGFDMRSHLAVLLLDFAAIFDVRPVFDYPDGLGQRLRNDYFQTLSELYCEHHVTGLKAWANRHGLKMRQQPAYGVTVDMAMAAEIPDVPETESLFFAEKIDAYRTMTGAAHIAGKTVISVESGCVIPPNVGDDAYSVTPKGFLRVIHGHFAGGVNQIVFHGMPYPVAAGAAWPGYAPFQSVGGGLAEAWGARSPLWAHMRQFGDYLGRVQVAMQEGRAQVDVAILRHAYWERGRDNWDLPNGDIWNDQGLVASGFSYDYISPSALRNNNAEVRNSRLAADGPAYKALILSKFEEPGQSPAIKPCSGHFTLATARRLVAMAQAGLPIVIVGELPLGTPYFSDRTDDPAVAEILAKLAALPNVRQVKGQPEVTNALEDLGVRPDAKYQTSAPNLYCAHRKTERGDLYFLYNQGAETTASGFIGEAQTLDIAFKGSGTVWELDPWTGGRRSVPSKNVADGRQVVSVHIPLSGARLIEVAGTSPSTSFVALSKAAGAVDLSTSRWDVTVEDWGPGAVASETVKLRRIFTLNRLRPWTDIPGLETASGIGIYETQFDAPASWVGTPLRLSLGPIEGTAAITLNGRTVPADQSEFTADVTGLVKTGANRLKIEVATTLNNRLRAMPGGERRQIQRTGLIGPVRFEVLQHTDIV